MPDEQTEELSGGTQGSETSTLQGMLGMSIFITAVSMLFAASVAGYLIIRLRHPEWQNPPLPYWLFVSTFLIIGSSMAMQLSLGSYRVGRESVARLSLAFSLALGVLYLCSQTMAWFTLVSSGVFAQSNLYAFSFYMLTVLHAIHVLGGLVPMSTVTIAAYRGRYSEDSHMPIKYMAMYWHCLAIIWIVLFSVLWATT